MSEVRDNPQEQRFELDLGGGEIAFADYRLDGDAIIFPHTVVPAAHGGQGIGTRLVEAALTAARERGLKVVPRCSFFAHYMKVRPETHDLLAPGTEALLEG